MAGLSEQLSKKEAVIVSEEKIKKEEKLTNGGFSFTRQEIGFILAKLAQIDFKGVEIEFTYNLILKLQEQYKTLPEE